MLCTFQGYQLILSWQGLFNFCTEEGGLAAATEPWATAADPLIHLWLLLLHHKKLGNSAYSIH